MFELCPIKPSVTHCLSTCTRKSQHPFTSLSLTTFYQPPSINSTLFTILNYICVYVTMHIPQFIWLTLRSKVYLLAKSVSNSVLVFSFKVSHNCEIKNKRLHARIIMSHSLPVITETQVSAEHDELCMNMKYKIKPVSKPRYMHNLFNLKYIS